MVRTCIIDAAAVGLLPTGNQFNIISGTMYPAKAGFTALLAKMKQSMGLIYSFEFDAETTVKSADPSYVAIPCKVSYKTNREDLKGIFKYVAMVKSNGETSTTDQLRGKAERKCKKAFVEFLTGMDLGEADPDGAVVDVPYTEVSSTTGAPATGAPAAAPSGTAQSASQRAREILEKRNAEKAAAEQPTAPQAPDNGQMRPNLNFDGQGQQGQVDFSKMTDAEIENFVNNNMGAMPSQEGGAQ